jgi:glutamyl/glutaminyl-tRNA synthetase
MLKTFEDFTVELNGDEEKFVGIIAKRFELKRGKENIVTAEQIIEGLATHYGVRFKESRVRKMIQFIRLNNLVPGLVANSKGYFVTETPQELEDWIESLRSRENAIRHIRETAEKQLQLFRIGRAAEGQTSLNF